MPLLELPRLETDSGKVYFVDTRLLELRNVENPHDTINIKDLTEKLSHDDLIKLTEILKELNPSY